MDELKQLADAVYNGLCLAPENGETTKWSEAGVTPPQSAGFGALVLNVELEDGRTAVVLVTV